MIGELGKCALLLSATVPRHKMPECGIDLIGGCMRFMVAVVLCGVVSAARADDSPRFFFESDEHIGSESQRGSRTGVQITVSGDFSMEKLRDALPERTFRHDLAGKSYFEGPLALAGVGVSILVPATPHLGINVGLHYAWSGERREHRFYSHRLDQFEEWATLRERILSWQILMRYAYGSSSGLHPYVEGGIELEHRSSTGREKAVAFDPWGNEYLLFDEPTARSDFDPFRPVGGAGCGIGMSPRFALDLRGQFIVGRHEPVNIGIGPEASRWEYAVRLQIGVTYRFGQPTGRGGV